VIRAILVGVLPVAAVLGTQNASVPKADIDAIKATAMDYAEGWYEGNADRMERAVHPDLAKRCLIPDPRTGKGKIDNLSALAMVQAVRRGGGKLTPESDRRADVQILDVFGSAASVKLVMPDWVEYLHMSKIQGRWIIVNILWEFTPEAKKKFGFPENY